jgi:hypothetical protein
MALLWIGIRQDVPVHPLATLLLPAVTALVNGTKPILPSGDASAQPFRPKVIANLQIASKQQNAILNLISFGIASIVVQTADKPDRTHSLHTHLALLRAHAPLCSLRAKHWLTDQVLALGRAQVNKLYDATCFGL